MCQLTKMIKREIKRQYRSIRQFSIATGIPQSTISHLLNENLGVAAYSTVMKMCRTLGITPENSIKKIMDSDVEFSELIMFASLDEEGKNAVRRSLEKQKKVIKTN